MTSADRWNGPSGVEHEHVALGAYQDSLRVGLIATPRPQFRTCSVDESLADVLRRNREAKYDYLPVTDASPAIIGVLATEALPSHRHIEGTVRDRMEPLGEAHLVGADASILAFLRIADSRPFRFVISGQEIDGLVSISDLQRLPVRAALFALVTHLEMVMADQIRSRFSGPNEWQRLMSLGRRQKLDERMTEAKRQDTFVDPVLYTQFADKVTIIAKSFASDPAFAHSKGDWEREMKAAQDLRNRLAHANEFAATRSDARSLCGLVRAMGDWIDRMSSRDSVSVGT